MNRWHKFIFEYKNLNYPFNSIVLNVTTNASPKYSNVIFTGISLKTSGLNSLRLLPLSFKILSLLISKNILGVNSSKAFLVIESTLSWGRNRNVPLGNEIILLSSRYNSLKFDKPLKLWSRGWVILFCDKFKTSSLVSPQKKCIPNWGMLDFVTCISSSFL